MPARADRRADRAGRAGPHHRQQQRRQRRDRPRRAAQGAAACARSSAPSRARPTRYVFDGLYRAGKIELELVPQGNLAQRIQAAGAGLGAFFTPTGYGTLARRGQGDARDRRAPLRARVPDPRRLRAHQGRARRPLGQPRLPQDRAQLRPDHGDGGAAAPSPRCARSCRWARSIPRRSSRPASSCSAWCRSRSRGRRHEGRRMRPRDRTRWPRASRATSPRAPT